MSNPKPDEFGRYRVAETVGGKTRHYSTKRYLSSVHRIVQGPDAGASFANGAERPPKFNVNDTSAPAAGSPKGA